MKKRMANRESRVGKKRRKRRIVKRKPSHAGLIKWLTAPDARKRKPPHAGLIKWLATPDARKRKPPHAGLIKWLATPDARKRKKIVARAKKSVARKRRVKVTRVRKNPMPWQTRSADKYIIEAMQQKGPRRFKFWYWTGRGFDDDRKEALAYPSRDYALAAAKKMLSRLPESILSLRAVKA